MLHYRNLHQLFFDHYPQSADTFLALTGYVGPNPVTTVKNLTGLQSKIIYGMVRTDFKPILHNRLLGLSNNNLQVLYSNIICHSKCYLWLRDNRPIRGFIGSANFSTNGLYNDYRESLFEIHDDQLLHLKVYMDYVLERSQDIHEFNPELLIRLEAAQVNTGINRECRLNLYSETTGQTQQAAGINWGYGRGNTTPGDAYLPISMENIRNFPNLFPPKPIENEMVELVWDDGTIMQGLLEGTNWLTENGQEVKYPKQISSSPRKNEMGFYLRDRLGLPHDLRVEREDLLRYGRDYITITLMEPGIYFCNFSRPTTTGQV
jgi:hypothetical protein